MIFFRLALGCPDTFEALWHTTAWNVPYVSTVTSVLGCTDLCLENIRCQAFQISRYNSTCFLFTSAVEGLRNRSSEDLYIRARCILPSHSKLSEICKPTVKV